MEVNEDAIAVLQAIDRPIAIVAACGPLHSGKSFLMNQLMGRTSGFALGPTTEPQTRGLWMWNTPIETQDHSIVFLDTEGLFASNISESYDAKIFAISNLLSSYLIYNSVKIIDQSAIDYIEILARRAQLFMVKAQLSHFGETSSAPLSPPSLLWIVQDFVSDISGGATPKEWLNRLLAYRKKNEPDASSLPSLFSDIDCETLFLPEYRKDKLRYLDQVASEDLLPEYKADMAKLRQKVIDGAKVKNVKNMQNSPHSLGESSSNSEKLNGAGAAALLRLLVDAANHGSFPEVPSLWNSFLQIQAQKALQDASHFYETSFSLALAPEPMPSSSFASSHQSFVKATKTLFSRLTFGFKQLEEEQMPTLLAALDKIRISLKAENAASIDKMCGQRFRSLREEFREKIWELPRPMRKRELSSKIDALYQQYAVQFDKEAKSFMEEKACRLSASELDVAMKAERSGLEGANLELLLQIIANASSNAVAKTSSFLGQQDSEGRGLGSEAVNTISKQARKIGNEFFEEISGFALEDLPTASASRSDLEHKISAKIQRFVAANDVAVEKRTTKVSIELSQELTRTIDAIPLPQPQSFIREHIAKLKSEALQKFNERVKDVISMEATRKALERLESSANVDLSETIRRNNLKYDRILADSLPSLKSQLEDILLGFWWPPNAVTFAREAVRKTLMQEELIQNEDLLLELSERFVGTSLQDDIQWLWLRLYVTAGCLAVVAFLGFVGLFMRSNKRHAPSAESYIRQDAQHRLSRFR